MFEAIRSKAMGAWKDLQSRKVVRLFVFELLVVTLGILLAQALADWANDRAAMRDMEVARANAREDLGQAMLTMQQWRRLRPCFEDRMHQIMIAASQGNALDSKQLERPSLRTVVMVGVDAPTLRRISERYGPTEAYEIQYGQRQANRIQTRIEAMADAWQEFDRIDRRNGTISPGDRDAVRSSAAEVLSILRGIEINAHNLILGVERIGITPIDPEDGYFVETCEEMWETGTTYLNSEEIPRKAHDKAGALPPN